MKRRRETLRSRLTTLVVAAIFGAVLIVTGTSIWREAGQYGDTKALELKAYATVFASAISDSVRSGDREAALAALRAIARAPSIEYARVELNNGAVFAEIGGSVSLRSGSLTLEAGETMNPVSLLFSQTAQVREPIVEGGVQVGWLVLQATMTSLKDRIAPLLWDALISGVFAAGIGLLIALRMQRAVTRPILALSNVMRKVRETGHFTSRAERETDDEIGDLADSFNAMLQQIRERDARLLAHQFNLKKIVARRTQELEAAKEAAEQASLAKTEFLATMSHEIRTPMNGMLVMAELLSCAELAPRQKRYADVIVKSGQSLLAIINDILDLSKIEAGKLDLERIPVSPAEIINDVVALFWERASAKKLDLAAYVAPETPEKIEGDPVRLNQILSNLLNNALKFTESGMVIVSARVIGRQIEFSVEDTGVGIAREKQAAIFEAFSQADQSTTRKFGGTGLGLAICRRLVDSMGGRIGVDSVPGKGSRFHVCVPLHRVEPPLPAPRAPIGARAIIATGGGATVNVLTRYLEEAGITVRVVDESAPLAGLARADMLFAGPSAFERLPGRVGEAIAPARICVSGLGDTSPDRLLESGAANDLLLKPVSRRDVMEQIERIFAARLRGIGAVKKTHTREAAFLQFPGARVLAADDSAVNREVVLEALSRLGVTATAVEDGAAALAATGQERFDLVLMDCSMPVMDGFAATRAIRERERAEGGARLPVVALTAHVAGGDDAWREAGMDGYLTKPFTLEALADELARHIAPRAVSPETSTPDAASASPEALAGSEEAPSAPLSAPPNSAKAKSGDTLFDRAILESLARMQAGPTSLVERALGLFETHSREAARRLFRAGRGGELDEIRSAAHALKSMSLNVGARVLASACSEIEQAAREGADAATLAPMFSRLRRVYQETMEAVPHALASFRSSAA